MARDHRGRGGPHGRAGRGRGAGGSLMQQYQRPAGNDAAIARERGAGGQHEQGSDCQRKAKTHSTPEYGHGPPPVSVRPCPGHERLDSLARTPDGWISGGWPRGRARDRHPRTPVPRRTSTAPPIRRSHRRSPPAPHTHPVSTRAPPRAARLPTNASTPGWNRSTFSTTAAASKSRAISTLSLPTARFATSVRPIPKPSSSRNSTGRSSRGVRPDLVQHPPEPVARARVRRTQSRRLLPRRGTAEDDSQPAREQVGQDVTGLPARLREDDRSAPLWQAWPPPGHSGSSSGRSFLRLPAYALDPLAPGQPVPGVGLHEVPPETAVDQLAHAVRGVDGVAAQARRRSGCAPGRRSARRRPLPPDRRSLPEPPTRLSLPAPPNSASSPLPPTNRSLPSWPAGAGGGSPAWRSEGAETIRHHEALSTSGGFRAPHAPP